jgi:hypothetical protein
MSIHTRLATLEQLISPEAPPAKEYKIIAELRELWQELTPILNESPAMLAVLKDSKMFGDSEEIRRRFWCTLLEALMPHPRLFQRLLEALDKQIKVNEAVEAEQLNGQHVLELNKRQKGQPDHRPTE